MGFEVGFDVGLNTEVEVLGLNVGLGEEGIVNVGLEVVGFNVVLEVLGFNVGLEVVSLN